MYERNEDQRSNYFRELALNLQYEGFTVSVEGNDLLLVALEGQRFCQVTLIGGVRYRGKDVTDEYMSLFGTAPFLRRSSWQ